MCWGKSPKDNAALTVSGIVFFSQLKGCSARHMALGHCVSDYIQYPARD
jgi:hypothetical protein